MNKINWMAARTEVTLTANEYNQKKSDYLFQNSIERILELCDQYKINAKDYKDSNKSISIVGERGSGKTSVVKTVSQILKAKDYFVFDIVDPGAFSGTMSLLELFISNIYLHINKNNKANSHSNLFEHSNNNEMLKFKIIEEIEGIMDTLANFRIDKSVFSNENTSMEVLNDINNRVSFNKALSKLIDNFKIYTGKENIVLCIDDLDLVDNKNIHNMLEDIRKYLLRDVIVIVSYRDVQLLDAVVQKNLTENKELKEKGFINSTDIYNQSTKYVEKLLPLSSRVYLQKTNEIWNQKNSVILNALLNSDKLNYEEEFVKKYTDDEETAEFLMEATVREWLTFAIFKKTKISIAPVDAKEEMIVGLPDNMRGLLQLIEIIHERLVIPNKNEEEYLEIIGQNLKIYKEYYYDFISGKLLIEEMKIIKYWESSPVESKNYNIYQALFHKIKKSIVSANKEINTSGNMDQLLNINLVSNENVTIGDVYEILERYKMTNANDPEAVFFVYVIKVIYSIELLQLYIIGNTDKGDDIDSYSILLNHKITPDTLIYVEKSNNIFKYNKKFINAGIDKYNKRNLNKNNSSFDNQINQLINNITYTTYTVKGENSLNSRIKLGLVNKEIEKEEILQTKNIAYSYKKYFNKNHIKNDLVNNYSYYFDILMLITNKDYIKSSFVEKSYIYYSMFDMDRLLRINFGSGNNNYNLYSVVRQIETLYSFSNKSNNFIYLYEGIRELKYKNVVNKYEESAWYLFDLLLGNRQSIVENFEKIKKVDIEKDSTLLLKYKELEEELYSINNYIDSASLTNKVTELENYIASNIITIPKSKVGLRKLILEMLEKEQFISNDLIILNNIVANTRLDGNLNKQDRFKFKELLDNKEIRNELK